MAWRADELQVLRPVLDRIADELRRAGARDVLVICSAAGDVPLLLARSLPEIRLTALELDEQSLDRSRARVKSAGLDDRIELGTAAFDHIPLPDACVDAVVSEFIVFPTSQPTQFGQDEIARVLRLGGTMLLTDVLVTVPLPEDVRKGFASAGLDYLCEGTPDDFRRWSATAGLTEVEIDDLTELVRAVWKRRRDDSPAYAALLDHPATGLGEAIKYVFVRGAKPRIEPSAAQRPAVAAN